MNRKNLMKYVLIDGLIVLLANEIAVYIPKLLTPSLDFSCESDFHVWYSYVHENTFIHIFLKVVIYSIPAILCAVFSLQKKDDVFLRHFVNIPLHFAFYGSIGWILYTVGLAVWIFVAGPGLKIDISKIMFGEALFNMLSALLSFTAAFFCIEIFHRTFVLKKYFPNGHFEKLKCIVRPTFKMISIFVYISIVTFPMILMLSIYFDLYRRNPQPQMLSRLHMVLVLHIAGIFIFREFISYFEKPLKKLKEGADYITKGDLSHHIDFVANDDLGDLVDTFNDMSDSLVQKSNKISEMQNSIIKGIAMMVESRDNSTGGHINRTSTYVQVFVNHLKNIEGLSWLDDKFADCLVKAAPMHDLGKIAVNDEILRKPGKFTPEEYEKMKIHAKEGARIVGEILNKIEDEEFKNIAVNVAHYHHEKWNGLGYPCGLSKEEIPIEARIMALADVYDALVSRRCYKDQFSFDRAFEIIKESKGSHFDPFLADEFLKCRPELEELTCLFGE